MTTSTLATTGLEIDTSRRMWHLHLPGRAVFGNGYMRPHQVVGDEVLPTGLVAPDISGCTFLGGGDGSVDPYRLAFVFYREKTRERSLPTYLDVTYGGPGTTVNFQYPAGFTSQAKGASHIEIYASALNVGGWYLLRDRAMKPGFAGIILISPPDPAVLVTKRPLENQMQTSIYPAVDCATYWNGAVYGARLLGRKLHSGATGVTITLTNGSSSAVMSGGVFKEADRYKPVMKNGVILFFIWGVKGNTAQIKLPKSSSPTPDAWDGGTQTLDAFTDGLSIGSEEQTVYVSPTYIGEEGNGLTRGLVTWNPLNQLREENQVSVGSRITAMGHDRDNLAVFFDKAIVIYSGDPGLDVPSPRSVTVSSSIGSLAQHHVWNTRDGGLWWLTRSRVFTLSGADVVDVTAMWGNASIIQSFFEGDDASNFYNWSVAYNPTMHQTIIVNMAQPNAADAWETRADKFGRIALLIDHGRQAFYKLEFPVRIKAITCSPRQDGKWAWFCTAVSAVQPGNDSGVKPTVYECRLLNDAYVSDNVESVSGVTWAVKSAMERSGGHSIPVGERLTVEAHPAAQDSAVVYTVDVITQRSLIHGSEQVVTSKNVTINDLKTKDWIAYARVSDAIGTQRRWSGTVSSVEDKIKLLSVMTVDDVTALRGLE